MIFKTDFTAFGTYHPVFLKNLDIFALPFIKHKSLYCTLVIEAAQFVSLSHKPSGVIHP